MSGQCSANDEDLPVCVRLQRHVDLCNRIGDASGLLLLESDGLELGAVQRSLAAKLVDAGEAFVIEVVCSGIV